MCCKTNVDGVYFGLTAMRGDEVIFLEPPSAAAYSLATDVRTRIDAACWREAHTRGL